MAGDLVVRPITTSRFKDVEALFMTDSIMRSCWDIWPRYAGKTERAAVDARHRGMTFFVRKGHRGRGATVALLKAAVEYAGRHGAPAVESYPRAPGTRVHDSTAFFGSVPQFRRAGFRKIAGPRPDLPKGWVPRYTMRAECS